MIAWRRVLTSFVAVAFQNVKITKVKGVLNGVAIHVVVSPRGVMSVWEDQTTHLQLLRPQKKYLRRNNRFWLSIRKREWREFKFSVLLFG